MTNIFCLLFFVSCMANRNYSHKKECCLGFFVIQKEIGKDDVLVFTINNSNATNVELSDPECLSNTFLELRDSSNKIIPGAFIKPIYQCGQVFNEIDAGKSFQFLYPISLNKMFKINPGHTYLLKASYHGLVKKNSEKFYCDLIFQGAIFIKD